MAWTKKASAPAFVNLASEVGTLITGSPDAWLLGWLHLLGDPVLDVNELCALGPETCAPIEGADFIGFLSRGKIIPGATAALVIAPKLACFARNRLFEAYCEQPGTLVGGWGAETNIPLTQSLSGNGSVQAGIPKPAGATLARVRWVAANPQNDTYLFAKYYLTGGTDTNEHPLQSVVTIPSPSQDITLQTACTAVNWRLYWYGSSPTSATLAVKFNVAGTVGFDTPNIPQPPEARLPPPANSTTIPGLSAQLDAIENKLGWILEGTTAQLIDAIEPMVSASPPVDVGPDDEIALDDQIVGAIILLADVGPQTDMFFGSPPGLRHVARLLIGNANGWLAPIDIQVSPLIVTGIPAGMTVAKVSCDPPATASIQLLKRASPAG